jgi:hypothetical protein
MFQLNESPEIDPRVSACAIAGSAAAIATATTTG